MGYVGLTPSQVLTQSSETKCIEFADREPQSEALAASVEFMAEVLRDKREISALSHVLVFHGGSGLGKTALSHRLEEWLQGGLDDESWGPPPDTKNVVTVRWDLNESHGDLEIMPLLLSLRAALPAIPGGWKYFDMALLSYFRAVRPGEGLDISAKSDTEQTIVSGIFDAIVSDFGYHLDLGTGIAAHTIKSVVAFARERLTLSQMRRYPALGGIIDRCSSEVTQSTPSPDVAAAVLEIATRQLCEIKDPEKRPLAVIFIDHFEKLQTNDRRIGEATINLLIGALPQCLFVISGRNHLDWACLARTALPFRGPQIWPRLVRGFTGENPRQHRLEMLGDSDSEWLFRRRAIRQGFHLSDATVGRLVERTRGWPVHIDAICTLASGITQGTGAEVAAEELDRPLEDVVRRVLENLTENQARAFHGACLLPYFDVPLAAAVADVPEGDVGAMIERAMIEPNDDPQWRWRVHDAVREIIRRAPAGVVGGWTDTDWKCAAHRGLRHVREQFDQADAAGEHIGAVALGGLAITIASEHGVWEEWLSTRVPSRAPAEVLAPLVPTSSPHPETDALVRYLHARVMRRGDEALQRLRELFDGESAVARNAGLNRAYKLRAWGQHDFAVEQLKDIIERNPGWRIPVGQIGITLNQGRRFGDALEYAATVNAKSAVYIRSDQLRSLGYLEHDEILPFERRIAAIENIRFRVELEGAEARSLARCGKATHEEIDWRYRRAVNIGYLAPQRACQFAFACLELANDELYAKHLTELLALVDSATLPCKAAVEAAALRAMLTRDPLDAEYAISLVGADRSRGASWIPVEVYLEDLGKPLDPVPTQWVEPYEEVRDRWLAIADTIIVKAKERARGA